MRFREIELNFKISDNLEEIKLDKMGAYKYGQVIYSIMLDVQEAGRLRIGGRTRQLP